MFVLNVSFFLLPICMYGGFAQGDGESTGALEGGSGGDVGGHTDGGFAQGGGESTGALEGGSGGDVGGHTVDASTWTCRYKGCDLPLEIECKKNERCYAFRNTQSNCITELHCSLNGESPWEKVTDRVEWFEIHKGAQYMAKRETMMCTTPGCIKDLVRDCPIDHSCFVKEIKHFSKFESCAADILCINERTHFISQDLKKVKIEDSLKAKTCEEKGCNNKHLHLNCPEHRTCWGELDHTSGECIKRLACLGTDPNKEQNEEGKWRQINFKEGDPTWLCTSRVGDEDYPKVECKVGEKCVARRKTKTKNDVDYPSSYYITLQENNHLVDEFYCMKDELLHNLIKVVQHVEESLGPGGYKTP